jgi:hypothetical protein
MFIELQVSNKDEDFFDLQVDVDQNTSITHCLRTFSSTETLCTDNKFKCDVCSSYQVSLIVHVRTGNWLMPWNSLLFNRKPRNV